MTVQIGVMCMTTQISQSPLASHRTVWLREDFKTVRAHVADSERFAAPAVGRSSTRRAKRRTKSLIMDGPATNLINAGVPPNGVPPASSKESSAQTPTETARKPWGLHWRSSVWFITFGPSGSPNRVNITI